MKKIIAQAAFASLFALGTITTSQALGLKLNTVNAGDATIFNQNNPAGGTYLDGSISSMVVAQPVSKISYDGFEFSTLSGYGGPSWSSSDLHVHVKRTGAGVETLRIYLTDLNFDFSGNVLFTPAVGGTTGGAVKVGLFLDDSNGYFDVTGSSVFTSPSFSGPIGYGVSTVLPDLAADTYSLTLFAEITLGQDESANFDFELSALAVPEAGSAMILLGMGCASLFAFRKRTV